MYTFTYNYETKLPLICDDGTGIIIAATIGAMTILTMRIILRTIAIIISAITKKSAAKPTRKLLKTCSSAGIDFHLHKNRTAVGPSFFILLINKLLVHVWSFVKLDVLFQVRFHPAEAKQSRDFAYQDEGA